MSTVKQSNLADMMPKQEVAVKKNGTVLEYLQSDKYKNQLAMALPKSLDPERFTRTALNEFRLNPALQQCSVPSVLGFFMQSAALGLEPATVLGHCYAVPFNNKKTGAKECQFILGYRGMLAIARRSGEVNTVSAHIVYDNDEFELQYGVDENIKHKPNINGEKGQMIGAYVVVKFKDGSYQHVFMSKKEIDDRRKRSKTSNYGPWVTDYEEMAKKTVFRAMFKWLPVTIEALRLVENDGVTAKYNEQAVADEELLDVDFTINNIDAETGEILQGD